MVLPQLERITFTEPISTLKARGQVEKWLHELEKCMKESVSTELEKAGLAHTEQPFNEWIVQWPGQCVKWIKWNCIVVCSPFLEIPFSNSNLDSHKCVVMVAWTNGTIV